MEPTGGAIAAGRVLELATLLWLYVRAAELTGLHYARALRLGYLSSLAFEPI
jgi:hypothetical protein